jgi:TorA maturation chaperone TorD
VPATAARVALPHPLPPEDQARADFYALLAALYAGGPDAQLLAAIAGAPALGVPSFVDRDASPAASLASAWERLRAASAAMAAEAAQQEYVDLFVGVGRCEVNLHASHWLTGFMMDKPLADLRAQLAVLGLQRRGDAALVEDHLSALCETMRLLIAGAPARAPADAALQRRVFEAHIAPWVARCTSAIVASTIANYYRRVAEFTDCFVALERDSLVMD